MNLNLFFPDQIDYLYNKKFNFQNLYKKFKIKKMKIINYFQKK